MQRFWRGPSAGCLAGWSETRAGPTPAVCRRLPGKCRAGPERPTGQTCVGQVKQRGVILLHGQNFDEREKERIRTWERESQDIQMYLRMQNEWGDIIICFKMQKEKIIYNILSFHNFSKILCNILQLQVFWIKLQIFFPICYSRMKNMFRGHAVFYVCILLQQLS